MIHMIKCISIEQETDMEEKRIVLTTANEVSGKEIVETLGVVFGDAIGSVQNFQSIAEIRANALENLEKNAFSTRADAVIGVAVFYESLDQERDLLLVSVSGTAVRFG